MKQKQIKTNESQFKEVIKGTFKKGKHDEMKTKLTDIKKTNKSTKK
jgi:hypothetical protein